MELWTIRGCSSQTLPKEITIHRWNQIKMKSIVALRQESKHKQHHEWHVWDGRSEGRGDWVLWSWFCAGLCGGGQPGLEGWGKLLYTYCQRVRVRENLVQWPCWEVLLEKSKWVPLVFVHTLGWSICASSYSCPENILTHWISRISRTTNQ